MESWHCRVGRNPDNCVPYIPIYKRGNRFRGFKWPANVKCLDRGGIRTKTQVPLSCLIFFSTHLLSLGNCIRPNILESFPSLKKKNNVFVTYTVACPFIACGLLKSWPLNVNSNIRMFTFLSPALHVRNASRVNAFCNEGTRVSKGNKLSPFETIRKQIPACRHVTTFRSTQGSLPVMHQTYTWSQPKSSTCPHFTLLLPIEKKRPMPHKLNIYW